MMKLYYWKRVTEQCLQLVLVCGTSWYHVKTVDLLLTSSRQRKQQDT